VKEFAANSVLTRLASNKVRRAGLCHQAGGELEKIRFFSARLRATIPNTVNDDIGIELKAS
jgi:hypothetical protein